jgi:hypothetical protein
LELESNPITFTKGAVLKSLLLFNQRILALDNKRIEEVFEIAEKVLS